MFRVFSAIASSVTLVKGTVPESARTISVLLGVAIVTIAIVLLVRIAWDATLDELLFGFIAMYLLIAIILMKVGVKNESTVIRRDSTSSNPSRDVGNDSSKGQQN